MKQLFFLFMTVCLLGCVSLVQAQDSKPLDILKKDVGNWEVKTKMWIGADGTADPDVAPMESLGQENNRMVGNWLISEFRADLGGMEFEGHAIIGYNSEAKKYQGSWVDSMNDFTSHMEGNYDNKTHTMTTLMTAAAPEGERKSKSTTVHDGDDKRVFTMFELKSGTKDEWLKSMEIIYTRKK